MDRPHGLKALLNELFGVRQTMAPLPVTPPVEEQAPAVAIIPDTPKSPIDEARITLSPDAVIIENRDTAAGPLVGDGDFCVRGSVDGGILTTGNVLVSGLVRGGVTGANISVQGGELCGDLTASAAIALDVDSLVVGNLSADAIDVAGLIKGNIRAKGRAFIRGTAVLTGDIEAKSALIEPGATIGGKVHITNCDA